MSAPKVNELAWSSDIALTLRRNSCCRSSCTVGALQQRDKSSPTVANFFNGNRVVTAEFLAHCALLAHDNIPVSLIMDAKLHSIQTRILEAAERSSDITPVVHQADRLCLLRVYEGGTVVSLHPALQRPLLYLMGDRAQKEFSEALAKALNRRWTPPKTFRVAWCEPVFFLTSAPVSLTCSGLKCRR